MIPLLVLTSILAAPRPTDSTLSVLVPAGTGCEWHRVDPLAKDDMLLAKFDAPCRGADVSWNHEQGRAVLFFPEHRDAFEVNLFTLETTPVSLPERGDTVQIGWDVDGDLIALTIDDPDAAEKTPDDRPYRSARANARMYGQPTGRRLEIDGKTFLPDLRLDGTATLAHAWRRERSGWTRVETAVTSVEACDSPAEQVLEASRRFEPGGTRDALMAFDTGDAIRDPALLERLRPFGHKEPLGDSIPAWLMRRTDEGTIVVGQEQDEDVYAATPVLFIDDDDRPVPATGLEKGRAIVTPERGKWLLIADALSGTMPRLYDLHTHALVWSSDTAVSTVFWPR